MTEQEAKTKWCPFARVLQDRGGHDGEAAASYNRAAGIVPGGALCIASECMAWVGQPGAIGRGDCRLMLRQVVESPL